MTNLDGGSHQRLVVDTSPFATSPASNVGFVHLNMLSAPASNPVLIGAHHARTELMQNAEGGFISRQPKLPLKLHRRHALRLAGNQIRRPEPYAERRVAALHHGANQKAGLAAAGPTRQDAGPRGDAERLRDKAAVRASEAAIPARLFKISSARIVVREKPLELRERFREWKVGVVKYVHSSPISASCIHLAPGAGVRQADNVTSLDIGGVCVNRIGTLHSSAQDEIPHGNHPVWPPSRTIYVQR